MQKLLNSSKADLHAICIVNTHLLLKATFENLIARVWKLLKRFVLGRAYEQAHTCSANANKVFGHFAVVMLQHAPCVALEMTRRVVITAAAGISSASRCQYAADLH